MDALMRLERGVPIQCSPVPTLFCYFSWEVFTIHHGNVHWRPDRQVSSKCPDKEIIQRGEIALIWIKVFARGIFPLHRGQDCIQKLCTSPWVPRCKSQKRSERKEHSSVYFLDNRKRCESPYQQAAENVSKAKRSKISGSKAELIDWALTHARGNLSLMPEIL